MRRDEIEGRFPVVLLLVASFPSVQLSLVRRMVTPVVQLRAAVSQAYLTW
jgi:hypothetical protein